MFSCLGLLSCTELCIFLCGLVLFVSTLAKWLAGKITTIVISFVSMGFPYKDQIEELFIVMVYCMYSEHVTLSTFSLISLFKKLQHIYQRHNIAYLFWKCHQTPINQSNDWLTCWRCCRSHRCSQCHHPFLKNRRQCSLRNRVYCVNLAFTGESQSLFFSSPHLHGISFRNFFCSLLGGHRLCDLFHLYRGCNGISVLFNFEGHLVHVDCSVM